MNTENARKQVYQLKITLKGSNPPIWRRVLVRADMRLSGLHRVIQAAMAWENCHLHEFRIGGSFYGAPNNEDEADSTINEKMVPLSRVASEEGDRFEYVYDFGDDWRHSIVLEKILPDGPAACPSCAAGRPWASAGADRTPTPRSAANAANIARKQPLEPSFRDMSSISRSGQESASAGCRPAGFASSRPAPVGTASPHPLTG